MEWQTAEIAPKDGTKILVYAKHGEYELTNYYEMRGYVYEEVGDGLYRRREIIDGAWNSNSFDWWMPLPAPPVPGT